MKKCKKCLEHLTLDNFSGDKSKKDGLCPSCKSCMRLYSLNLRIKNGSVKNPYTLKEDHKLSDGKRSKANEYAKRKRNEDPLYRFKMNIRTLINLSVNRSFKGLYRRTRGSEAILGCDLDFFLNYIEDKFTSGMSWSNYGKWHLDHIIPIKRALTEEEVIKLNHYSNFQPLWARDNLVKSYK